MYKYSSHWEVNESTLSEWDLDANDAVCSISGLERFNGTRCLVHIPI
jgi:hypothetical protein